MNKREINYDKDYGSVSKKNKDKDCMALESPCESSQIHTNNTNRNNALFFSILSV